MPEFVEAEKGWKPRDFAGILAEIEAEQASHPGMWGVVARYESPQTAANRASELRKKYTNFLFRSSKDDDGNGVVYAQHVGGEDPDGIEAQD